MSDILLHPRPLRCHCEEAFFTRIFMYDTPPKGEVRFAFSCTNQYRREVLRCDLCGHFISQHQMDSSAVYAGDYVDANYGDIRGLRCAFERITALDPARSDNIGRVQRVLQFASIYLASTRLGHSPTVLDVGSGLCVFLYRMKAVGWECTALDPDPRAVAHAQETVGVRAICGDFMTVEDLGCFDVVTFNKVLEHVEDPIGMLTHARRCIASHGFIYIEVPDGEAAVADGPEREEFFIDHLHMFSSTSLALLIARSGFSLQAIERLREPSGKYTLRAFVVPT